MNIIANLPNSMVDYIERIATSKNIKRSEYIRYALEFMMRHENKIEKYSRLQKISLLLRAEGGNIENSIESE